jgi:hypothetical protein
VCTVEGPVGNPRGPEAAQIGARARRPAVTAQRCVERNKSASISPVIYTHDK